MCKNLPKTVQRKWSRKGNFLIILYYFQNYTLSAAIPRIWLNICLAEQSRCTPRVQSKKPASLISSVTTHQQPTPPLAVLTYSRRPRNVILAKQFLSAPTFQHLVYLARIDLIHFQRLLAVLPSNSDFREFLTDFQHVCSLSIAPPKELAIWSKHSIIWQIHQARATHAPGVRLDSPTPVRELFKILSALPFFLRNLCVHIILQFKLASLLFIETYPRFLRNKNSTRSVYENKIAQMADWFELTPENFGDLLFSTPVQIQDIEILENIFYACQTFRWLGATASQYISALKHLGTIYGSSRFHSDTWKTHQKNLRKTFGKRKSDQRLKKAIKKSAIKKVYALLKNSGRLREAEILRFMALTGQRNIDYKKFVPADIYIDYNRKIIYLTWKWGKTRELALEHQKTLHPFGTPGTFFDLHTCVLTLLQLKTPRKVYLLRTKVAHSTFLRNAFKELPTHEQPDCTNKLTPYFFKNVLARCCLETKIAAEVASHYLKHSLSDAEWKQFCSHSHINLSNVSANYAISENLVPHISACFAPWWNASSKS